MQAKSAFYIGEALIRNPKAQISQIFFKDIKIDTQGLYSLLEGANINQNLKSLHIGIVTDEGLATIAECVGNNKGNLLRLEF